MAIVLRPYQSDSVEAMRAGIRDHHTRQIVCAPTGSGKTEIGMALITEAIKKGSKTAFICDRTAILNQTSQRFDANNIPHGIIQGGHWRWRPYEKAQICMAQTLARRGVLDDLNFIIVDEAHTLHKTTVDFILAHPEVITIGLTATPFRKGIGEIYTNIVNVTTTNALMKDGYLAPLKVFAAKPMDMRNAAIKSTGEWDEKDMEKRGLEIVGDVIQEWIVKTNELFGGPVKTIVFSATIAHGEELCRQWQAAGHNFQQITCNDTPKKRAELIREFRETDSITGLVSCEALAKGFDVPAILMGVSCRPYRKSLSGHIQQVGRVMRTYPGKDFAGWNDHSGNFLRFYNDTVSFFEHGLSGLSQDHLDATARKEPDEKQIREMLCGQCKHVMSLGADSCSHCGWIRPKRPNEIEHLPGSMHELELTAKPKKAQPDWMQDKQGVWRQIVGYALEVKGGDLIKAEKFALAQFRNMYEEWPYRKMAHVEPMEPTTEVRNRIRSQMIRYAKRRNKEERPAA